MSSYYQEKIMDQLTRDATHVALHTADPGSTGSNEVTLTRSGYERQEVTFDPAVGNSVTNTNVLDFDDMPPITVTHIGLWDADVDGRFLWSGMLLDPAGVRGAPLRIERQGDILRIEAGRLEVSID